MRPNWLTIAIVPALCASMMATGLTLAWLQYSLPMPTAPVAPAVKPPADAQSGRQPLVAGAGSVVEAQKAPTAQPSEVSASPTGVTQISGLTGAKDDKAPTPWSVQLIERIAWPLTLICVLCFIAYNARLARLFGFGTRLVKKITAGGVNIEINSEAVELVQRQLHGTFEELVTGIAEEYAHIASIQDIPALLKNAIVTNVPKGIKGLRGTIHVNDVIFPDYLYQLVDYYPSGGGSNRRFSQRFGIIGRSWRSKVSHGTGDAFAGAGSVDALIENWGMTEEEAQGQVNARPSCLSIVVRYQSIPMGILFIDSLDKDAFGTDTDALALARSVETSPAVVQLGEALAKTLAPLRTAAPSLKISGPAR